MQAAFVSRELKQKFERIVRDGNEQYELAGRAPSRALALDHLKVAEVAFAQASIVADIAAAYAPTTAYRGWLDRRSQASQWQKLAREQFHTLLHLAEEACGCERFALGGKRDGNPDLCQCGHGPSRHIASTGACQVAA